MARNKVEACMFCGAIPCECNKPAKPKPKPKKKPKAAPEPAPAPTPAPEPVLDTRPTFASLESGEPAPTVVAKMRAEQGEELKRAADERRRAAEAERVALAGYDEELARAIGVLRDARILSRQDQARANRLAPRHLDPEAVQKMKEWKERRDAERDARRVGTRRSGGEDLSRASRYANFKPVR